jgi:hypothetical protein
VRRDRQAEKIVQVKRYKERRGDDIRPFMDNSSPPPTNLFIEPAANDLLVCNQKKRTRNRRDERATRKRDETSGKQTKFVV